MTRGRRIAVFDYLVMPDNPAGSCHLEMLRALSAEHRFTVFAVRFANPCPERIEFVRVPAPVRPLALLFLTYRLLAPIRFWTYRLRRRARFDLVQAVDAGVRSGDIAYTHFCHRAYLRRHWKASRPSGLRGALHWIHHRLRAAVEPGAFRKATRIVVPSRGLMRELSAEYPAVRHKIEVIPNPIDLDRMRAPGRDERARHRRALGLRSDEIALAFVALGHFERKGLPLVLEALERLGDVPVRLVVVGGTSDLLAEYRRRIAQRGLEGRVLLVGQQADVRTFLWACDGFVLPSRYETFSLVSFQAAAAGLPLVVSALYGVEDLVRDDDTGFLVDCTAVGVAGGIARLLALSDEERRAMGERARGRVETYGAGCVSPARFAAAWRAVLGERHVA